MDEPQPPASPAKKDAKGSSHTIASAGSKQVDVQYRQLGYDLHNEIELQFLLLNYREGFRYYQGVLVPGAQPIVFQVEQASAFDKVEERAIRLQIKRILGEDSSEVFLDLLMSEPSLFAQEERKKGRAGYQNMPLAD